MLRFFIVLVLCNLCQAYPSVQDSDIIDIPLVVGDVGDDLEFEVLMGPTKILAPTPTPPAVIINHPIKGRRRNTNRHERRDPPIFVQPSNDVIVESKNEVFFESEQPVHSQTFEPVQSQIFETHQAPSRSNLIKDDNVRQQRNILPPSAQNNGAQNNRARQSASNSATYRTSSPPESTFSSQQSDFPSSSQETEASPRSSSSQPSKTVANDYSNKKQEEIPILRNSKTVSQKEDKAYQFDFESGNGILREEKGFLKNPSSKNPAQVMSGSWSYTGPDGKVYTITYVADENGFRAEGDHLPVAPSG